jgi:hypothetical protein
MQTALEASLLNQQPANGVARSGRDDDAGLGQALAQLEAFLRSGSHGKRGYWGWV